MKRKKWKRKGVNERIRKVARKKGVAEKTEDRTEKNWKAEI